MMDVLKKEEFRKHFHEFFEKVQKKGFWVLLLLLIGSSIGIYASTLHYKNLVRESILMHRFISDGIVYDITPSK